MIGLSLWEILFLVGLFFFAGGLLYLAKRSSRWRFLDLWRLDGTIGRGTYATVGLVGFAIKHNLDRLIGIVLEGDLER